MVRRHELTDEACARIVPLLSPDPRRRQRSPDHRAVLNGTRWRLSTGDPWRDLSARYGPWLLGLGRSGRPIGGHQHALHSFERLMMARRSGSVDPQTAPLVSYYRGRGLLVSVDGVGTVEAVAGRIEDALAT